MVHSMTGFGRAQEGRSGRLTCEIRSVNHRFLTTKVRAPSLLQRFESDIDGWVRKDVARGSVEVSIQLDNSDPVTLPRLDTSVADHYVEQIRKYQRKRGLSEELPVEVWIGLPGVLAPADAGRVASLRPRLQHVVETALEKLLSMRKREGARLEKVLRREIKKLGAIIRRIGAMGSRLIAEHRKRLEERIGNVLAERGVKLDEATLAREVAVQSDRSDVTEELDRLESHLIEFGTLLQGDGPAGRAMDFLIQEIGREVNTIGSKVQDLKARREVLQAKAVVEKLREQVQNLE